MAVRRHRFVVCERTAAQEIDPHDLEVVAAGEVLIEEHAAALRVHLVGDEAAAARAFVERDVVDDADAGHARQGAQAIHEVEMQPSPRRPVDEPLRLFRRELEGVDVRGVVAGIDVAQSLEALDEQRRADEQHQRQRRLRDHERVASPAGGVPCCRARPRAGG